MNGRLLIVALTAIAIPASFIRAPYPDQLVLQHVPTVFGLLLLGWAVTRKQPSTISFTSAIVFLWLHIIGARWIYSFVPYDEVFELLFGTTLTDYFGWRRNHYDRLVHVAFGLLGVPVAAECLQRGGGLRPCWASALAFATVLAAGSLYEIMEWQIAMQLSPATAESYNGQQGDRWDPQKDMALAALGAACSASIFARRPLTNRQP